MTKHDIEWAVESLKYSVKADPIGNTAAKIVLKAYSASLKKIEALKASRAARKGRK